MLDSKIWTEKFRPKTFEDVMGQEKIVARISSFVKQKNIPHLLFSGPAGTGKSTIALVIAKELFGDLWQQNFLETNASEERGIQTVREKIKDYVRTKAMGTDIPKIIFLDEADALTREAQQALRRMMEQYTSTARFILSCVTPDTKILLPEEIEISIKDYFNQFDMTHFAFVIHGKNDSFPLPAGSYKSDYKQKQLFINYSDEPVNKPNAPVIKNTFFSPKNIFSYKKSRVEFILKNT
ncbi:AAA family ATPase, partial [Candidatus Woesearchaeota archaeon]|nr:AAA family ATPase [Candidatus Woesearchaeota archaeon]